MVVIPIPNIFQITKKALCPTGRTYPWTLADGSWLPDQPCLFSPAAGNFPAILPRLNHKWHLLLQGSAPMRKQACLHGSGAVPKKPRQPPLPPQKSPLGLRAKGIFSLFWKAPPALFRKICISSFVFHPFPKCISMIVHISLKTVYRKKYPTATNIPKNQKYPSPPGLQYILSPLRLRHILSLRFIIQYRYHNVRRYG